MGRILWAQHFLFSLTTLFFSITFLEILGLGFSLRKTSTSSVVVGIVEELL